MAVSSNGSRIRPRRSSSRRLLIVARDQGDFYEVLRSAYRGTDETLVLRDRRQGERRRAAQPVAGERRLRDRRSAPGIANDLRSSHYALVDVRDAGALAPPHPFPNWRSRVVGYLRAKCAAPRGTPPDSGREAGRERLQQQCAALREEVRQLHAEVKRLQTEREMLAQWFATMLQEAAARFPLTPPPA